MNCEFTEEVSQFLDGELPPPDAARLRAHMEGCVACQQAREAFLLLRHDLSSYARTTDPHAQSRALASILGTRTSASNGTAAPHGLRTRSRQTLREVVRRLPRRLLNDASGVRRLGPAYAATLALLLIGFGLGLRWLVNSNRPPVAQRPDAPAAAHVNDRFVPNVDGGVAGATSAQSLDASDGPTVNETKAQKLSRLKGSQQPPQVLREQARVRRGDHVSGRERLADFWHDPRPDASDGSGHALSPLAMKEDGLSIGRHAERVERLLRSFRNARLIEGDQMLDVAEARRLSRRLLYANIALRRGAAGEQQAGGWLDTLEPILVDISNLPDKPSPDAVGLIKERIRRRQLVGVLQTQALLAAMP